jgi:hypothetical protein
MIIVKDRFIAKDLTRNFVVKYEISELEPIRSLPILPNGIYTNTITRQAYEAIHSGIDGIELFGELMVIGSIRFSHA